MRLLTVTLLFVQNGIAQVDQPAASSVEARILRDGFAIVPLGSKDMSSLYRDVEHAFITVDVIAHAASKVLERALADWDVAHASRWRALAAAITTDAAISRISEKEDLVEGLQLILAGWPESAYRGVGEGVRTALARWIALHDERVAEDVVAADRASQRDLLIATRCRDWLLDQVDHMEEGRSATLRAIDDVLARSPELAAWSVNRGCTLDILLGSSGRRAGFLWGLQRRTTDDMRFLERLDPVVFPGRTYVGGVDLLVGPFRSEESMAAWRQLEHGIAASALDEAKLAWAPEQASAYAAYVRALAALRRAPAPWTRDHPVFRTSNWAKRVVQSQMAAWVGLRRAMKDHSRVVIYGNRGAAPRVVVDPYPEFFREMQASLRIVQRALCCDGVRAGRLSALEDLAGLCMSLEQIAEDGPESAVAHQPTLLIEFDKRLQSYIGESDGAESKVVVGRRGDSGTLVADQRGPLRLRVALSWNGEQVIYDGAVLTYVERWWEEGEVASSGLEVAEDGYSWVLK